MLLIMSSGIGNSEDFIVNYGETERILFMRIAEDKLYFYINPYMERYKSVWIYREMIEEEDDGYMYATVEGVKIRLVWGGGWSIYHPLDTKGSMCVTWAMEPYKILEFTREGKWEEKGFFEEDGKPIGGIPDEPGVEWLGVSSYLREKVRGREIHYTGEKMVELFVLHRTPSYIENWYFNCASVEPWVEGVEGPGIGEKIRIRFKGRRVRVDGDLIGEVEGEGEGADRFVVLNGFVDPLRPHLYKMNNRVKRAVIRSVDGGEPFEVEVAFPDVVKFHVVKLPRAAKEVEFEIREVYRGTKWDDTCVTGFFLERVWDTRVRGTWEPAREVAEWERSKKK